MKRYLFIAGLLMLLMIVFYLFFDKNPIGVYTTKNNVNTIDTIVINKDGTYDRMIYNSSDKKLIYRNTAKWEFTKGRILFTDFFPNPDKKFEEGYNFKNVLMDYSIPLQKSFGRTFFGYDLGRHIFYKQ